MKGKFGKHDFVENLRNFVKQRTIHSTLTRISSTVSQGEFKRSIIWDHKYPTSITHTYQQIFEEEIFLFLIVLCEPVPDTL